MVVAVVTVVVGGPQLRSTKLFHEKHAKKKKITSISSCSSIFEQWVRVDFGDAFQSANGEKGGAMSMLD